VFLFTFVRAPPQQFMTSAYSGVNSCLLCIKPCRFEASTAASSLCGVAVQTYYKLPFVDHSIAHPEVPICEDVPKLARGLAELLGEWLGAATDGLFYSVQLQVRLSGGCKCVAWRPCMGCCSEARLGSLNQTDPSKNTLQSKSSAQLLFSSRYLRPFLCAAAAKL